MSTYTKLHRSIWQDNDFVALPATTQRLYLLLISQADISHCGVLAITVRRWSLLAPDSNETDLLDDLARLAAARFVIIDHDTQELFVRSYMVYDGLSRIHNGDKAIANAAERVLSQPIRAAIQQLLVKPTPTTKPVRTGVPTEVPIGVPTEVASVLQQPTANRKQITASSQQPAANEPVAAVEAIAAWIRHRCDQPNVRSKPALARKLRETAHTEHWPALLAYLAQHPDATWQQLCSTVFAMSELDIYRTTL